MNDWRAESMTQLWKIAGKIFQPNIHLSNLEQTKKCFPFQQHRPFFESFIELSIQIPFYFCLESVSDSQNTNCTCNVLKRTHKHNVNQNRSMLFGLNIGCHSYTCCVIIWWCEFVNNVKKIHFKSMQCKTSNITLPSGTTEFHSVSPSDANYRIKYMRMT